MKIAFVTLPGMIVGGIPSYIYRLAKGMMKIGHVVKIVVLAKTVGKGQIHAYAAAGMRAEECVVIGNDENKAIEFLNGFDYIVYEQAGGYNDLKHSQTNDEELPWYYGIIRFPTPKSVAFIHSHKTYTKHSPYINIWENFCNAFCCSKEVLALDYQKVRGKLDMFIVPLPIEIPYYIQLNKDKIIASTNRLDPVKRMQFVVEAMPELPEWKLDIYSGENIWYCVDDIKKRAGDSSNIHFHLDSDVLDLNGIYDRAALVYDATKFPPEVCGGTENAILEGVVRGAVPLISDNWAYSDGFPEPSSYKFSINGNDTSIADVVSNIDPNSKDFKRRQNIAMELVRLRNKDTVVAKLFTKVLKSV